MEKNLKCESCGKADKTVSKRKVREDGVVGYYEVEVCWCNECVRNHYRFLLENWG
jgi:hypothetical protein